MPTDKYWSKGNIGSKQVFQVVVIKKRGVGSKFFSTRFFYALPVDEILYLSSCVHGFFPPSLGEISSPRPGSVNIVDESLNED